MVKIDRKPEHTWIYSWSPLIAFLVITMLSILAWWQGKKAETDRLKITTKVTAEQMGLRLHAWIEDRIDIVEQLAQDWQDEFSKDPEKKFPRIALNKIKVHSGFQAINWIDPTWHIRIVVPKSGNEAALDKDLHNHPEQSVPKAITRALKTGLITRSEAIELLQGVKGFATYRPVRDERGSLVGMVNGVFRISTLVDLCLAEQTLRKRFRVAVYEADGQKVYSFGDTNPDDENWPLAVQAKTMVVDKPWLVKVAPTPAYIAQVKSLANELTLVIGLLLAVVIALLLHLFLQGHKALRHEERRLRDLTQNVPSVIYQAIPDENFTITFVSKDIEDLTGYSYHDFVGNRVRSYGSIIHPDDFDDVKNSIKQATSSQRDWEMEYRIIDAEGHTRYVHEKGLAVRDKTGCLVLEGFLLDITDKKNQEQRQKATEEQLQQAQKMEAIGRLAGGVAHDFNNILTGIVGNAELLLMEQSKDSSSRAGLEEIVNLSKRASRLTGQLLAFSRKQVLNPRVVNPGSLIGQSKKMIERIIGEDIRLLLNVQEGIYNIEIDPVQFDQILLNLVVNAKDAMEKGGDITINLSNTTIHRKHDDQGKDFENDNFVCLSVKDTGCGIDPNDMDKIFEPFFSTKPSEKGTGLGLATIYGIVEQNGGTISVESEPGSGSTFYIYLPAKQVDPPVKSVPESSSEFPSGTETLLVVEDEDQVRDLTKRVLEKCGYKIIEAAEGYSALKLSTQFQDTIHMVITDIVMPGMNGKVLTEKLQESRPEIKILFMSGHSENIIEDHGLLLDGLNFIQKPFNVREFTLKVRTILDKKQP